jgi:putative resolvase
MVERRSWIPMEDGVRLAASLFLPEAVEGGGAAPVVLEALPYRKDDATASSRPEYERLCGEYGYAVARVDLRGRSSEGVRAAGRYICRCRRTYVLEFGMKLSEWAERQGIHYMTAWRWWKADKLPVPAYQSPSGSIIVELSDSPPGRIVIYARVSSHDQRLDLDRQIARVARWTTQEGLQVAEVVAEVGAGLNGKRAKLRRLLADPQVTMIVVEHRDRLARFGVEYLAAALAAQGRRIVVVEEGEATDDLVRDMVEVLTSFCARLYGRRGARNRAMRALTATKDRAA